MASRLIPNVRWRIAALLFCATVINYIDRQTLSVLAAQITEELGISDIEYAQIVQAFLICYAGMYIVWGRIIDRWGTRVALALSMVWWSLANAGHALARGALGLGVFRALLGLGESGNFLAAEKAISEWFPPKERGFANGIVNAAASTGAILAPPLIVLIFTQWGWRAAFVVTGATGFVWLAYWLRWYWVPARHPRVTAEERSLIEDAPGSPHRRSVRWAELFQVRQTWALFLARVFGGSRVVVLSFLAAQVPQRRARLQHRGDRSHLLGPVPYRGSRCHRRRLVLRAIDQPRDGPAQGAKVGDAPGGGGDAAQLDRAFPVIPP